MSTNDIPVAKPVSDVSAPPPAPQASSGRAMAALVLGILSIICAGFLTGIPAIIVGQMELKAIKAGHAPQGGEGIARVGFILGIVGTVFTCLAILAFAALMALGISLSNSGVFENVVHTI